MEVLLEELNDLRKLAKQDFLNTPRNYLSAQRALEMCITTCIDVASHIISIESKKNQKSIVKYLIF